MTVSVEEQARSRAEQSNLRNQNAGPIELEELSDLYGPSLRTCISDKIAVAALCVVSLISSATGRDEVRDAVTRILHEGVSFSSIEQEYNEPYQKDLESLIDPNSFDFPAGGYSRRKDNKKKENTDS